MTKVNLPDEKEIHTIDVDTFEHGYVNKIFKNINMEG